MEYDKSKLRICDTCKERVRYLYYRNGTTGEYIKTNILYCKKCEEIFD